MHRPTHLMFTTVLSLLFSIVLGCPFGPPLSVTPIENHVSCTKKYEKSLCDVNSPTADHTRQLGKLADLGDDRLIPPLSLVVCPPGTCSMFQQTEGCNARGRRSHLFPG